MYLARGSADTRSVVVPLFGKFYQDMMAAFERVVGGGRSQRQGIGSDWDDFCS